MAAEEPTDDSLTQWYSSRIGKPDTADEARGYLLFALGVVLGIVGVGLLISNDLEGPVPQWPVVLAAVALILLIAGPLIRLPLRPLANVLVYLGALLGLAAVPWFVTAYPGWRDSASMIIGLYSAGLLIMAVGGVFVPILGKNAEREAEIARQQAEIESQQEELSYQRERLEELQDALEDAEADEEDLAAVIDEIRAKQADTVADEADLAARLEAIRASQARFELYQDRGDQWRWRLRHRNGNVIGDSGEGYTRKHNAQKGMQSVRRNALGATVMHIEREEEVPEEDEEFEPVVELESQGTYEIHEDAEGKYRWRLLHRNGNILADSGEGYSRRNDARRAADRLRERIDDLEFEVFEDNAGEYRWRLTGGNDRIVADSGEGYSSRSGVEEAVERIQNYAPDARILDIGRAAFEVFEDKAGEFRWRLRHRNGNILADSGEGYTERNKAYDAIESVKRNAPNAEEERV